MLTIVMIGITVELGGDKRGVRSLPDAPFLRPGRGIRMSGVRDQFARFGALWMVDSCAQIDRELSASVFAESSRLM
jgi:hypothetical protein